MKRIFINIIAIIVLFSCEERTDIESETFIINRLVVEGMITNERTRHEVRLTLPVSQLNQQPLPVSGALVAITDQERIFTLEEDPDRQGYYLTEPDVQGVTGKRYTLYIRIGEFEFTASSYMVPAEPLKEPLITACGEEENRFHIIPELTGDPFMLQIRADWSGTGGCSPEDNCSAVINHYHLNTIDVNDFFKPEKEIVCVPSGTMVTRKKYSLNPEHQEFIRSLLMETEWRGGVFDVERGNVITNLSQGGIGYFAASTVVSDSFIIE